MPSSNRILPLIIISQFFCTSLWFAVNGVIDELVTNFQLPGSALAHLTSAVQLGFISGTLFFAFWAVADRFSPSRVFFVSALAGSAINLLVLWDGNTIQSLLLIRFFVGFFLAGIYPVGMKIAADYFDRGLGRSLGYLVGALVLGTALPHLLKGFDSAIPWIYGVGATSVLALVGGVIILLFVPDGPYRRAGQSTGLAVGAELWRNKKFVMAALGYFGHMWELYAFWAFVPVILQAYVDAHAISNINIALWSFAIIGSGSLSCVAGGYLSERLGVAKVAFGTLSLSLVCCLLFPLVFTYSNILGLFAFLLLWGVLVIPDSPLFSTLVAKSAPDTIRGSAITIATCLGFLISIGSIQLMSALSAVTGSMVIYSLLGIGPLVALWGRQKSVARIDS